jgi:hypothetical protein
MLWSDILATVLETFLLRVDEISRFELCNKICAEYLKICEVILSGNFRYLYWVILH